MNVQNPVLSQTDADALAVASSQTNAATVAALTVAPKPPRKRKAKDVPDSEPVALGVIAERVIAWAVTTERVAADATLTAATLAESLAGLSANVAEFFHGATGDLPAYKVRREAFDKAVTAALVARNKAAKPGEAAIAEESVKRAVRRILQAAKVERPEATTPEATRKADGRKVGAIAAALHMRDHAALAKAVKAAGGPDAPIVAAMREATPEAFELVETFGARKAKLLELIAGLAPDAPTMARLYEAANL
jgi:hypothetical protein